MCTVYSMLNIIGGTYIEKCREPNYYAIFGSGLRAAIALADKGFSIKFNSCVGDADNETIGSICNTFQIMANLVSIEKTISFVYDQPLAKPKTHSVQVKKTVLEINREDCDHVLYYGMIEATCQVNANYLVYDPQNGVSFKDTGSNAKHLAIILNKQEAVHFYGADDTEDLNIIGKKLIESEDAEVIVIKNGSHGALIIDKESIQTIPVFRTDTVWPIGSGDIFSAVFAWKWIEEKLPPREAVYLASLYTAFYCETKDIPLPTTPKDYEPLMPKKAKKRVYLAGPFFNMGERWLISELRKALLDFDNLVFSPYHDVGIGSTQNIVDQDIEGIVNSDVMLAVVNGLDSGTLFEIGYAIALGKKVIVMAENISDEDLLMLKGTKCEITDDFSTAIYRTSW